LLKKAVLLPKAVAVAAAAKALLLKAVPLVAVVLPKAALKARPRVDPKAVLPAVVANPPVANAA